MTSLVDLTKAIVANTAIEVLNCEQAITTFREALVRDVAGFEEGQAFTILESVEFRAAVFPLAIEGGQIVEQRNPIWDHSRFILPLVAKLALFFDSNIDPRGTGRFEVSLIEQEQSLSGYELVGISVVDGERFDRDVFALMVAGAAKSFLTDVDGRSLAMWALRNL